MFVSVFKISYTNNCQHRLMFVLAFNETQHNLSTIA